MESTKGMYIGQPVVVTVIDEEKAEAYEGIVIDTAATGASALVVETTKCDKLLKEHGTKYIEAAKDNEVAVRVKAGDMHPVSKETNAVVVKFKETATKREVLTKELKALAKELADVAKKAAEELAKKEEEDEKKLKAEEAKKKEEAAKPKKKG